ncbi:MAG: glutamate 5-kinase [Chloroflexi bacterium]|nr:glutamate 5-kinase [Chloroflexota bacterium]
MAQIQRPAVRKDYARIVVKAGTAMLTDGSDQLDLGVMTALVGQIASLHEQGKEILLVSSGAVAAGRHAMGVARNDHDLPLRQVLAAVGQGHLMHTYEQLFASHRIVVAQALLSRRDITDRLGYLNIRNTLLGLLDRGVVPIINENDVVAVEELRGEAFGDNDTLSALVANLVDSDLLVMLGEVEGLYTADPHVDPDAELIPFVERLSKRYIESVAGPSLDSRGRGGMTAKLEAARLATASGVQVVVAGGKSPDALTRLASGEAVGTLFPPMGSKMESRKRWMLSSLSNRAEIVVDVGAVRALVNKSSSLLPAGITEVLGRFDRGDTISILGPDRSQVACGITSYGSQEVDKIKGHHSHRIGELAGSHYGDEVVHRNNMVIMQEGSDADRN